MKKVSVVILTKNEEKNIDRCFKTLSWADEIVVVDTGSTDQTLPLVREYTQTIVPGDISKGFAYNRNLGNEAARNDWILKLDPDEEVSDVLREEILKVMQGEPAVVGFHAPTKTFFGDKWVQRCGWYPMRQVRLFNKQKASWHGLVHEYLVVDGETASIKSDIPHYSYGDIQHYFEKFNLYTSFDAHRMEEQGRKVTPWNMPSLFLVRPVGYFIKSYFFQKGWKDGFYGFVVSVCSSFYVLIKYLKLYEVQNRESSNRPERPS